MHCALMSLELKASHGCHSSVWSAEFQHQKNPHGSHGWQVLYWSLSWRRIGSVWSLSAEFQASIWKGVGFGALEEVWIFLGDHISVAPFISLVFRDILQIRTSTGSSSSFFSSGAVDPPWCGRLEVPLLAQDGPHPGFPFLSRTDALLLHLHIYDHHIPIVVGL